MPERRRSIAVRGAIFAAVMVVTLTNPGVEASAQAQGVKACTALAEDGQRLRAAGKLIDARDKFIACSAGECPQVVRTDCAQWASEVLAATPTIVIDAKDADGNDLADAKVYVDDEKVADRIDGRPIAVEPGQRKIRVERTIDGATGSITIVAKENAKAREVKVVLGATSTLSGDEPPRVETKGGQWGPWHYVGLGMIAVGAIGIAYSTIHYISYRADESELLSKFNTAQEAAAGCDSNAPPESTCGTNIAERERLRAEYNQNEQEATDERPIVVTFAVAGVLLIGGGVTLLALAPKTSSSSSVRGAPVITPHFAGMMLGGTF